MPAGLGSPAGPTPPVMEAPRGKPWWRRAGALLVGAVAALAGLAGWRPSIAPVSQDQRSLYSAETLARGRALAALGNCAGCHTVPGGAAYAGGRAFETPFGTVLSSNLTPDPASGIGAWSFSAFQRAMREGISRDGHRLYPAFPYTAFTRLSDDELMALYAHLQSQPAVAQAVPESQLRWPFSLRPLMALWNALHLQPGPAPQAGVAGTSLLARGRELVLGLGHCTACHSPRDALGAERGGAAFLAGAWIEGWQAPPLVGMADRALPWSEQALLQYLRQGHSAQHGVAAGPMADVVRALAEAPESEVRAMAAYLASLQGKVDDAAVRAQGEAWVQQARAAAPLPDADARLFESACGACHSEGRAPVDLGLNLPLALNGKLRSASPDNLLHVLLDGIQRPPTRELAFMPAFRHSLDDAQLAALSAWLRRRFAPDLPPWGDAQALQAAAARVRAQPPWP